MKSTAARSIATLLFFVLAVTHNDSAAKKKGDLDYPRLLSLRGTWQRQYLANFSIDSISAQKWSSVEIPYVDSTGESHFVAYRKRFDNPVRHAGERVFLHFKGVALASLVYLNDHLIGEHGPTLEPFSLELTLYLKKENELVVLVQDWTSGISVERGPEIEGWGSEIGKEQRSGVGAQRTEDALVESLRGAPDGAPGLNSPSGFNGVKIQQGKEEREGEKRVRVTDEFSPGHPLEKSLWHRTVSPIGGNYRLFGIWDEVWLEVARDVRVEDLVIEPWVKEGKIRITGSSQVRSKRPTPIQSYLLTGQAGQAGQADYTNYYSQITQMGADFQRTINRKGLELNVGVEDGNEVKVEAEVQVKGGRFEVVLDASDLEVWEPETPKMYRLIVEAPEYNYRKEIPFGFRTVKVKGQDLYLNSKRIHLFTASIGSNSLTPRQLTQRLNKMRELNINAVRFHANVFPEWYYDICDRMGMLVVAETAINGSYVIQNDYGSDLFFENAATHWKGLVRKLRNHPSVVVYSIENECVEYSHGTRAEEKFAELGKKVKQWDPTRPILFNGGDDPGGVADIISLHYPHELPFWNQYPKEAWWSTDYADYTDEKGRGKEKAEVEIGDRAKVEDQVKGRKEGVNGYSLLVSRQGQADSLRAGCRSADGRPGMYIDSFWYHKPDYCWRWDRKKPLDLGEIGYFCGGEPHMDAVLWGDAAYDNPDEARDATRAEVWRRSIEAARALDVCMINPWNPPAGKKANEALKESLNPIKLVFYPVAGVRYYGGSEVNLPAMILNDSRESKTLFLAFLLRDGQNRQKLSGYMGPFPLPPGQGQNVRIRFQLSEVDKVEDRLLCCTLLEQNGSGRVIRDQQEWPIRIHPDPPHFSWAGLSRVRLFDPQGNAARLFQAIGVGFQEVRTIPEGKETPSELLVIGPKALSGLKASEIRVLKKRLSAKETCTLILAQEDYPLDLPFGFTLNHRHGSSICFLSTPRHLALSGIADEDVQLWAGDLLVSRKDFNLPAGGGFQPLLISGGTGGLRYSPLIEKQKQKGGALFCQLSLAEKFWDEPSAAQILFNILRYFESKGSSNCGQRFEETCCRELPQDLESYLQAWGIRPERAAQGNAGRMLLFVRAANYDYGSKTTKEWLDWVNEGNVLWVSGLEPASMQRLRGLASDLKCVPLSDDALPLKINKNCLLAQGLLNQDFYWTEPHPICTYRFARLLKPSCWALTIQPENPKLPWKGLSFPAVLMAAHVGQGWLLVDTLDWSEKIQMKEAKIKSPEHGPAPLQILTCTDNQERALRLLCGLLSNLGAQLEPVWGIKIEAENMSEKTPGQPLIRNRNHHYWAIFKNNYLAHDFDFLEDNTRAGKEYLIDVKARCRIKKSIPPRMKVLLDGKTVGECFVDKSFWCIYRFKTAMKGVKHRLEVHLVNNPEDAYNHRYLHVDWVEISSYEPGHR